MACQDCELQGQAQAVGSGGRQTEVIFLGESPGRGELLNGNRFSDKVGDILSKAMISTGIDQSQGRYLNATRCTLNKKALGQKKINATLHACRDYMAGEIRTTNPKIIIAFGEIALRQLIGKQTGAYNKVVAGNWYYSAEFDCDVLACVNPAAILYNPALNDQLKSILSTASRYISNGYSKSDVKFVYKEVDSIRPLLDGGFVQDKAGNYLTALDTETQGVQWYLTDSVLISYSIAASFTEGWQIYLQEEVPVDEGDYNVTVQRGGTKKDPEYITVGIKRDPLYEEKVAELRELLGRSDIKVYYANMKFEKHRWWNLDIKENNNINFDVLLAAHTLDSEQFLNASLDQVIKRFDPESAESHKGIIQDRSDMLGELSRDRELFTTYSAADAIATLRCGRVLRDELLKDRKVAMYYAKCVHPIETDLLFELERNGVYIDTAQLPKIRQDIQEGMAKQLGLFHKYCPDDVKDRHPDKLFRPTRSIIMQEALYDFLNEKTEEYCRYGFGLLPFRFSPKTKLPSVDKESLAYLLKTKLTKQARNLITAYQEWQTLNTIETRYLKNIEKFVTPEGRLHPSYSITFTSSGRTGARSPSIQNFPKRTESAKLIRRLMIAPPGKLLVELDHATLEIRVIAHVAKDRTYIDVYRKDGDPHYETGIKYSKVPVDQLSHKEIKVLRQNAKPINFGLPYGMSASGLQAYARTFGVEMSERRADNIHRQYFSDHPDIVAWHNQTEEELRRTGQVRTIFGRIRHLPGINSKDRKEQSKAIRIGINVQIQNPASDLTLLGGLDIIKSDEYVHSSAIQGTIFLHDALFFEIDEEMLEHYVTLCKNYLENVDIKGKFGFDLSVPLKIDAEYGHDLANTTEL